MKLVDGSNVSTLIGSGKTKSFGAGNGNGNLTALSTVGIAERPGRRSQRQPGTERVIVDGILGELRDHARIIEGAEAAPDAGSGVSGKVVGETKARSEVRQTASGYESLGGCQRDSGLRQSGAEPVSWRSGLED